MLTTRSTNLEARVSDLVKQLFAAHAESRDLQDLLKSAQDTCAASQVRWDCRCLRALILTCPQATMSGMESTIAFLKEENSQLKQTVESMPAESKQRQVTIAVL